MTRSVPREGLRALAAKASLSASLSASILAATCAGLAGAMPARAAAARPPANAAPIVAAPRCGEWPAYRAFLAQTVQPDGRVFDASTPAQQSTSEGQSYGMFLALAANDRASFERMLEWTRANLAGGHFDARDARLPAWQWGRKADGGWGVLDPNSAADADLWIAYDLLEAGRLWHVPDYSALGAALAAQIARREVVELAGLGPMLLPGPQGFVEGDVTRLNPSYLPLPVLRALGGELGGPWNAIARNGLRLVAGASPRGFAPDWAAWRAGQVVVDPRTGDLGSYDAIRTYLWAGLANPADPLARPWLDALRGMAAQVAQGGVPPEKVAVATGAGSGEGPLSYWGALAPYFAALGDARGLALARARLSALDGNAPGREPVYYDRVLGLFGAGAVEGRYRFDAGGRLLPAWSEACR